MAPISYRVFCHLFGYVSSAVTRPDVTAFSETVRSEIFESMNLGLPNQPAAPNAGIASRLTIGHLWPGVGEPERSRDLAVGSLCVYDAFMTDAELKTFRNFLEQHLPGGTAHMSDTDLAGIRHLMDMVGNPSAASNLIAEIDALLGAPDSMSDAKLCDG